MEVTKKVTIGVYGLGPADAQVARLQATLKDVSAMQDVEEKLHTQFADLLKRVMRINVAKAMELAVRVDDWETLITECETTLEAHRLQRTQGNEKRKCVALAAAPHTRAAPAVNPKGKGPLVTHDDSTEEEEDDKEEEEEVSDEDNDHYTTGSRARRARLV